MRLVWCVLFIILKFSEARVGFGPGQQEWGYEIVRPGAHTFWWLYYTTANVTKFTDRPLIVWLQGGPGASSTGYGNFAELGPLDVDLKPRNFTWVKDANVLFVDNPVGTGFSYVDNVNAYATTNRIIALDLVSLMKSFYKKLPQFEGVPLYILSESYGGKMAIEFAYELHKAIKNKEIKSNLIGTGLGDAWIHPIDIMESWAPLLFQTGMVHQKGHDRIVGAVKKCKDLMEKGMYAQATTQWGITENVIIDETHGVDFYNILTPIETQLKKLKYRSGHLDVDESEDEKIENIMNLRVKKALNLTGNFGVSSSTVFGKLSTDFMKPVTNIVEKVLNETSLKVFVYGGQLDLIVDIGGTVVWVDKLTWKNKTEWDRAPKSPVSVNNINEGYKQVYGNFGMYWINRAGHMVPRDNFHAMRYLLQDLTNNFAKCKSSMLVHCNTN